MNLAMTQRQGSDLMSPSRSADDLKLRLTRRRFLLGSATATLAVGTYTWRVEPHWVSVVRRDMPWMIQWLSARLTGTAEPPACTAPPAQTCPGLPPNKD